MMGSIIPLTGRSQVERGRQQSSMTRALIYPAVGMLILGGIWLLFFSDLGWREVAIPDVTRSTVLKLRAEPGKDNVSALGMRISGNVEGKARVTLLHGDHAQMSSELSGEVSLEWVGDWYSPEAELRYDSSDVRSGHLQVEYRF